MSERKQLEEAIAALEGKRGILGDVVIEKALAPLRERLAEFDAEGNADVRTAIHKQPTAPTAAERRVITILFCDVKGSTAMAEQHDPEEWAGIINHALDYIIKPVQRHGGKVAEVRGDGILAFFGAPVAHEDDPQRAVLSGLEILEGVQDFHEQIQRERGLDFDVRVGIHTGLVVVGDVGVEQQVEYTAIGDAVNLAARMEQTARPGTVHISHQTYKLVEQVFECEPLGELKVKGKREPIRTYQVSGLKAKPGRAFWLERPGLYSPLVGREAEFAMVKACLDRLVNGQGGILGILGEAGIGKSRLVAEVRTSTKQVLWLEGHTLSFGQTISYWPFQQILRGWASIAEDDHESEVWTKLEVRVRALFGEEIIDYLPYLASLLTLEVRGDYAERVKYLDGDAMGKQIFLTSRRFFERLAWEQPTVLVFEDLHWMDESSTHLLQHLLPLVEQVPLLIVGLSRPERDTPAARLHELSAREYGGQYTEIRLAPLSGADSAQLMRNLLESENLPPRLRELVVEKKAEGNPFFLEEVIRALIDTGAVTREPASGRWRATAQIEAIHLPDTIQGVIMARVDRLQEEVKQVLRAASVIGRSFLYRVLKAIAEVGQRLDDDLTELQHSELIREKQHLPELEYMFKHALAQEATYESILLQKRHELHARVGRAIESLFADRLEEFYGLLAYHYAKAEAWEKARDYLLKAGDQTSQMAADTEALAHYKQAIVVYGRLFGDKWDPLQRASLERKMGEAYWRRGQHAQALEYCHQALIDLGRRLPTTDWGRRWVIIQELAQQIGHRVLPGLFHKNVAGAVSSAIEEEARLYVAMIWMTVVADPQFFFLLSLRLLNFSEQHGYLAGIVPGASALGTAGDVFAVFWVAGLYHRQAVAAAERLQHPGAVALAYQNLTLHDYYMGKLDAALEHGRRAAEIYREVGDLRGWGLSTMWVTLVLSNRGDFALALAHAQDIVRSGRDGADDQVRCWGLAQLGLVEQRMGRMEDAIMHLQQVIELAETIPDYYTRVGSGGELGGCDIRLGRVKQGLSVLELSQRISVEQNMKMSGAMAPLYSNLAAAYLLATEQSDDPERADWLKKAGSACKAALKQSKAFRPAKSVALRLQGTYEWLRGKPVASQKWWQRSLAEAERIGLCYDLGMVQLEIGQRLGNPAYLEKAEAIFTEIGAELDLARTRNLARS